MQNYKRVIKLSVLCVIVGLYIFIYAITAKPVVQYNSLGHGKYSAHGSGIVSTRNKYKVISATVRITIYGENDKVITSQFFDYSEHRLVEFNFRFTENEFKRMTTEIYDAKIDNKTDIVISLILISFGLGFGINTFVKNKNCYKEEE